MQLTPTAIADGLVAEYGMFADLVETLSPAEWAAPSRCAGFDVRDVAGHVIGLAEDVAAGTPGSRNAEEEAASVRNDPPAEAARRLRTALDGITVLAPALTADEVWNGPSGVPDLTMGEGVLLLWYDLFVHADDIRAAIGRPSVVDTPGMGAALVYLEQELTKRNWGPARVVFPEQHEGFGALDIRSDAGTDSTAPSGPVHRVQALPFILAATGRLDPTVIGLDPTVNIYAA